MAPSSRPLPWFLRTLPCALALLLAAGCSHTGTIAVDSIGRLPSHESLTYAIVEGPDIAPGDAVFQRAAALTRAELDLLGLRAISEATGHADVVIAISYDVSAPRQQVRTERVPGVRMPDDDFDSRRSDSFDALPRGAAGAGRITGAPAPRLETHISLTYAKSLTLVGCEPGPAKNGNRRPSELWRVSVSTIDGNPEVLPNLPRLVEAAISRLASDLDRPVADRREEAASYAVR